MVPHKKPRRSVCGMSFSKIYSQKIMFLGKYKTHTQTNSTPHILLHRAYGEKRVDRKLKTHTHTNIDVKKTHAMAFTPKDELNSKLHRSSQHSELEHERVSCGCVCLCALVIFLFCIEIVVVLNYRYNSEEEVECVNFRYLRIIFFQ